MKLKVQEQYSPELSRSQQKVYDFYSEHPGATHIECCKEIYGRSDVFLLQNLQQVECALRKRGHLFYSVNGRVWDIASKDTDLEIKLIVQNRLGKKMIGYLKSNIRILRQGSDKERLALAKEQFKETVKLLVDEKIITLPLVNRLFLRHQKQLT